MAKKNVPYDQEYYDKEIETHAASSSSRNCSCGYLKDDAQVYAYENMVPTTNAPGMRRASRRKSDSAR